VSLRRYVNIALRFWLASWPRISLIGEEQGGNDNYRCFFTGLQESASTRESASEKNVKLL